MKRLLLLCGFIIVSGVFLMAQDIDAMVKTAVDGLALRVASPIEASIGEIYLEGTVTPSAFSRYLANRIKAHATDTGKINMVPLSHSNAPVRPGTPQKGIFKGTFRQTGGMVNVTLQLVSDPGGQVIETRNFSIPESSLKENGIDVLPANIRTREEIIERERLFAPPVSQQTASALQIKVWPDSDTGTYFAGDKMTVNLWVNRDGYVRVDYIDVDGNLTLVFPNILNRDNSIRADQVQVLPRYPAVLTLDEALGMERVWVRVSTEPFVINESEFAAVKTATRDTVAASRTASGRAAEAFFSITKLPATFYDETWSYKPDNCAEDIQNNRLYVRQQGGNFSDDDREGSFSTSEAIGVYRVTGDTVTVSLRNTSNQLFTSANRGATNHNFSITKPSNITLALEFAKSGFQKKGGDLLGDEQQGSFWAKIVILGSLVGRYSVSDKVYVTITEIPLGIKKEDIENEVRKTFGEI